MHRGSSSGSIGVAVAAAAAVVGAAAAFNHILCRDMSHGLLFVLHFAWVLTHLILIPRYVHVDMLAIYVGSTIPVPSLTIFEDMSATCQPGKQMSVVWTLFDMSKSDNPS